MFSHVFLTILPVSFSNEARLKPTDVLQGMSAIFVSHKVHLKKQRNNQAGQECTKTNNQSQRKKTRDHQRPRNFSIAWCQSHALQSSKQAGNNLVRISNLFLKPAQHWQVERGILIFSLSESHFKLQLWLLARNLFINYSSKTYTLSIMKVKQLHWNLKKATSK